MYAYSAYANANLASSNTITLQGIENAQNTNIASAFAFANTVNVYSYSAYSFANTINTYAYSAFTKANNALANSSGVVTAGSLYVTGLISLNASTETANTGINPGASYIFDLNYGPTWEVQGMSQNWTANFTNVPTTINRTTMVSLMITQGATPYYPSTIQVNGTTYTPKWLNGTSYTGNAIQYDFVTFNLFNQNGTFLVFGSYATYI